MSTKPPPGEQPPSEEPNVDSTAKQERVSSEDLAAAIEEMQREVGIEGTMPLSMAMSRARRISADRKALEAARGSVLAAAEDKPAPAVPNELPESPERRELKPDEIEPLDFDKHQLREAIRASVALRQGLRSAHDDRGREHALNSQPIFPAADARTPKTQHEMRTVLEQPLRALSTIRIFREGPNKGHIALVIGLLSDEQRAKRTGAGFHFLSFEQHAGQLKPVVRDLVPALEKLVYDGGAEPDDFDLEQLGDESTAVRERLQKAVDARDRMRARDQNFAHAALSKMPQSLRERLRSLPGQFESTVQVFWGMAEVKEALLALNAMSLKRMETWYRQLDGDERAAAQRYAENYLDLLLKAQLGEISRG